MPANLFTHKEERSCLLTLPDNRSRWEVPAFKIKELLEQKGHSVVLPRSGMITFQRTHTENYPKLRQHIKRAYMEHYPSIHIHTITIKPTAASAKRFAYSPHCTLKLTKSNLRRKRGTFITICGKKRHFFQYDINASITLYKANHQIKKDKIIDSKSVRRETVPFEKMNDTPLFDMTKSGLIARQNIAEGRIITEKMVLPLPDVRKNERVLCIYHDGPVTIEFEATALQNGYIGDNITLKKSNGVSMRGVVVGQKTVEIR